MYTQKHVSSACEHITRMKNKCRVYKKSSKYFFSVLFKLTGVLLVHWATLYLIQQASISSPNLWFLLQPRMSSFLKRGSDVEALQCASKCAPMLYFKFCVCSLTRPSTYFPVCSRKDFQCVLGIWVAQRACGPECVFSYPRFYVPVQMSQLC